MLGECSDNFIINNTNTGISDRVCRRTNKEENLELWKSCSGPKVCNKIYEPININ